MEPRPKTAGYYTKKTSVLNRGKHTLSPSLINRRICLMKVSSEMSNILRMLRTKNY